ncbi:MAG TPA: hypothetical protein VNV87_05830 [Acidimicrobiales bacterium]|nr:hypothetical protein [Acidimicrobiales bacterium]
MSLDEPNLDRHPDGQILDRAAQDVGRQPEPVLLGEFDDSDHVGRSADNPNLMVDRERRDNAPP